MPTWARAHALVPTHNRALRTQNPRYSVDAWPGNSASGSAALRSGHTHPDEDFDGQARKQPGAGGGRDVRVR
jgi:hypothetical protein